MKQIGYLIIYMFLLVSCSSQQEIEDSVRLGSVQLNLSQESLDSFVSVMTKAAPEEVDINDLQIEVKNTSSQVFFSGTYKELKYNEGNGLPLSLPVGDYKVEASFNMNVDDVTKASLYGESDFVVYYNKLTQAKVLCEYQCIKVTLQTSTAFDAVCKDNYTVSLMTSANESCSLSKESTFVFFRSECSSIKALVSVETKDGREISYEYDLAKKDNQVFKLKDSAIIKLDIQETKSLKLETEVR